MRVISKTILCSLLIIMGVVVGANQAHAGVNDFDFSDFTGDYYLSRDEGGISHLKVKESVTAVFPDYEQNKGICRQIPFTNQNGKNLTLSRLTRDDINVTRNGAPEPIYSIEKEGNYYNVCTGTDEYVLGEQVYTFEYEFTKVVTEFEENGKTWQELYWDTNGNGASQHFDKVTARLHFEDKSIWTGEAWCYVGLYGKSGKDRCTITKTQDGVMFEAEDLLAHENLTFDVEIMPGAFVVPGPEKNYIYVWLTVGAGVLCLIVIGWALGKFMKNRKKTRYYKSMFVKPEYQPSSEYTLPEMAEIYVGKKKDIKVAMLLELVVKKKFSFIKVDEKKWKIKVNNLDNVRGEYLELLAILNGGERPDAGDEFELKKHEASSKLMKLKKSMDDKIKNDLYNAGLTEMGFKLGRNDGAVAIDVFLNCLIIVPVVIWIGVMVLGLFESIIRPEDTYGQELVFYPYFYKTLFVMVLVTVPIVVTIYEIGTKYEKHTEKGLEAARYMDGLKLYIEMAEAERMKVLQSVKGADVSPEGIVKLYEKLLPYAAIFGLEESWMEEMKKYCEVAEVEEPDYLMHGLVASDMMRAVNRASTYVNVSTVMSSSGGGSSSGFSGGGGGGFSGGGGGGGGFSGR